MIVHEQAPEPGPAGMASLWCIRLADGLTPEQDLEFAEWISADPANEVAFGALSALWQDLGARAETPEMLKQRAGALGWLQRLNRRRWSREWPRMAVWSSWIGIAACLALVVGAALNASWQGTVYSTGIGERRVVVLEDGSRISLDGDTRVSVHYERRRRELSLLSGRAKFDVAKNHDRPFTVQAGSKVVLATGTSFSVERLDHQTRVILYEGHVLVSDRDRSGDDHRLALSGHSADADSLLTPGRELVAQDERHDAQVLPADVDHSLSWEMGMLDFHEEPLGSAVARWNRYASPRLEVDDARTARIAIDGVFHADDAGAFVSSIVALYPVSAVEHDGIIHLRARPD